MNAYTWMMAIVLFLALIMKGQQKNNRSYIFLSAFAMFFIMGMREATKIGCDSASSYLHAFQKIADISWSELSSDGQGFYNIGFKYLMKAVSNLTDGNYQTFIIIISAFIMIAFAHFISKYSVSPVQSFCYYWGLLIYIFMFSAEKQALAMSVLLFAFDAIMEQKPIKFVFLVFLASMFHFPALVFLPAYWIEKMNINRSYFILLVLLLAATYAFRNVILRFMLDAYGGEDLIVTMDGITFLRNKVLIMIGIVLAALVLRRPTNGDRLYSLLLKFTGIAIIFQTFCGYNNIFERLADYYFQFEVIFIPMVFERTEERNSIFDRKADDLIKTVGSYAFCGYGVWRFASTVNAGVGVFLPYKFFFM